MKKTNKEVINPFLNKEVPDKIHKRGWFLLIAWILTIIIFSVVGWKIGKWFEINQVIFKSPVVIKFQQPIAIKNREVYKMEVEIARQTAENERKAIEQYLNPPKEQKCSSEVMEKINPKKFWDIIWESESTKGTAKSGKHIACRNKGKWNEIGYSPSTNFCFNSKEEAQLLIPFYVSSKCNGMTMSECLCFYNTGHASTTCAYSEGNLSLAN